MPSGIRRTQQPRTRPTQREALLHALIWVEAERVTRLEEAIAISQRVQANQKSIIENCERRQSLTESMVAAQTEIISCRDQRIAIQDKLIASHRDMRSKCERIIADDLTVMGAAYLNMAEQTQQIEEKDSEIKRLKQMLADNGIDSEIAYVDTSLAMQPCINTSAGLPLIPSARNNGSLAPADSTTPSHKWSDQPVSNICASAHAYYFILDERRRMIDA
jgi:hypothetical protein